VTQLLSWYLPGFVANAKAVGFRRSWITTFVALQILAVTFEAIGLASIVPVLEYMRNSGGTVEELAKTSHSWGYIVPVALAIGLPIGFGTILVFTFLAIVLRQLVIYLRLVYTAYVQQQMIAELRHRGFSAFLHASEEARSETKRGEVVNSLTAELQNANACMTSAVNGVGFVLVLMSYLVIVVAISPTLSAAAFAITVIVGFALAILTRRLHVVGRQVTAANQAVTSFLIERFASGRLIRLCGMETPEKHIFSGFLLRQKSLIYRLQRTLAMLNVTMEPVALLLGMILLYFAVESGAIAFEPLVLFFFILLRLVPVAKEVVSSRQTYLSKLGSIDAIVKNLNNLESGREHDAGNTKLRALKKGIEFKNVGFSYAGDRQAVALKRVNLTIPARKMTAIVGPSGSGKSTLVDLLPRLRKPSNGKIYFDGINSTDIELASLRRSIAFAPQTPQMFDVTVREHIRYGKANATEAELHKAAELAQAIDFIRSTRGGFDAAIGDNGSSFSGGQRQRLDLARALISEASILILDEPTSHLDAESAGLFHSAIENVLRETNKTIVLIGHSLRAIRDADQIVVLIAGEVAAAGTHTEVLAECAWYRESHAALTSADDES